MTVEEFYQWCKKQEAQELIISTSMVSENGCFVGYEEVEPERNVRISHSDGAVYLG